jgi:hypothetical protein
MGSLEQNKFDVPCSGIMDPVEHSVIEEGWGAGLNRPDGPQLLERWGGITPIPELIERGPRK